MVTARDQRIATLAVRIVRDQKELQQLLDNPTMQPQGSKPKKVDSRVGHMLSMIEPGPAEKRK